jgi:hypothetical protein
MKQFLESKGYRHWKTEREFGTTEHYQKRMDNKEGFDSPLCQCNDKLFINIKTYDFNFPNGLNQKSNSISLCHENEAGEWCDLEIYSLKDEEMKEKLDKLEDKLICMWEEFNK